MTVERKEGRLKTPSGKSLRILDLPGTYSLHPRSPDEKVTHDVLYGNAVGEKRPDYVVCVVDATNLRRSLRLVIAVQRLGIPCMVALNMTDMAEQRGVHIDEKALARELGIPVVRTVGIAHGGDLALKAMLEDIQKLDSHAHLSDADPAIQSHTDLDHERVRGILSKLGLDAIVPHQISDKIDM